MDSTLNVKMVKTTITRVMTVLHTKQSIGIALNWFQEYDDVIKRKHFPRCWPFVWGVHRSPLNSPHKGQWRRAFMFSLICTWINGWVNNREAVDFRRHRAHYEVIVMGNPTDAVPHFSHGTDGWALLDSVPSHYLNQHCWQSNQNINILLLRKSLWKCWPFCLDQKWKDWFYSRRPFCLDQIWKRLILFQVSFRTTKNISCAREKANIVPNVFNI